ncbi:hypothetical protein GGR46_003532 [Sphingomonas kyeonggiensis]|uniref:Uncharacterized protein n=1 Tax=Sphingomonas kyeonggiensis TaxID=1268553 RepID=A0A7W6JUU2_9SPHN|nr:hypothetical protein [Sphingomonas kyeonggiensis]
MLLRFAVAGSAVLSVLLAPAAPFWCAPLVVVIGASLCVGIGVRASASLGLLAALCVPTGAPQLLVIVHAVTAASLVLTGAGAYSLDARFFGRRRVVLPGTHDTSG